MLECTVEDNCVHNRQTVEMLAMRKCSNPQLRTTVYTIARRWTCSRDGKMLECTVEDNCGHNRQTVEMRVRWELARMHS